MRQVKHTVQEARVALAQYGSAVVSVQMEDGGSFDLEVKVNRFFDGVKRPKCAVEVMWRTTDKKRQTPLLYIDNTTEQTLATLQAAQVMILEEKNGLGLGKLRLGSTDWKEFGEVAEALGK